MNRRRNVVLKQLLLDLYVEETVACILVLPYVTSARAVENNFCIF